MSPSTRRRATLLLWLMLALLPLRGWAMGVMGLAELAHAGGQILASEPACHDPADGGAAVHGHALCDVCHAAAAPAPSPVIPYLEEPAGAVFGWTDFASDGNELAGPYKPPRR